jgi:hypothetical protein
MERIKRARIFLVSDSSPSHSNVVTGMPSPVGPTGRGAAGSTTPNADTTFQCTDVRPHRELAPSRELVSLPEADLLRSHPPFILLLNACASALEELYQKEALTHDSAGVGKRLQ